MQPISSHSLQALFTRREGTRACRLVSRCGYHLLCDLLPTLLILVLVAGGALIATGSIRPDGPTPPATESVIRSALPATG